MKGIIADIVELGASVAKKGVALWQGGIRIGPEPDDLEPLGDGDVYQGLGVSSLPYPADSTGKAEAVALRGVNGRPCTYVGARDTRSAAIVGNLKPGDTVIHSTGPSQAAQVQCKEDKRQALLASKDRDGKTIVALLDGSGGGKFQVVLAGMILQMDAAEGSFSITNGKASIIMSGSAIILDGDLVLGGKIPDPANKIVISPAVSPVPTPTPSPVLGSAPSISIALPGS